MLDLGITFDYAQFLIDNEIYRMIRRVIGGIDVSDANMAIDIIKEIGPGGELVSHQHTFDNFRKEQSHSKIFDRSMRETWVLSGCSNLTDRAYEEADNILKTHKVAPLPESVLTGIREIIAAAEEEYGIKR